MMAGFVNDDGHLGLILSFPLFLLKVQVLGKKSVFLLSDYGKFGCS